MTNQEPTTIRTILGIIVFFGFIWLVFLAGSSLASVFLILNPNVAAAIVAAFATVAVSIITVYIGKNLEAKSLILKEQRENKVPVYEELLKFIFEYQFAEKTGRPLRSGPELAEFLSAHTQKVMIWGSDEMIAAWVKLRTATRVIEQKDDGKDLLLKYEALILAIRKDLGHKNKGMNRGDILRLTIDDIE